MSEATPVEKLIAPRELVKRWMAEELRGGPALTSPNAVREYLKRVLRKGGVLALIKAGLLNPDPPFNSRNTIPKAYPADNQGNTA